jgi:hypothetical protein
MGHLKNLSIILLVLPLLVFGGCEVAQESASNDDPTIPAGTAGLTEAEQKDGPDDSLSRPGSDNSRAMDIVSLQYHRSGHALGAFVDYAGGRASCARCHSNEGFVEFAANGFVEGNIENPTPFHCGTCHDIEQTDNFPDYSFRIDPAEPVPAYVDGAPDFDFGDNSNLCANCHQARRWEPNINVPGETYDITSVHWGPHHGPQANVYAGLGFAEIPGSQPFGVANPHLNQGVTCVTCHMSQSTDGTGGHTFRPSESVCALCHDGGFDANGGQSDNQERMIVLRDLLVEAGVMVFTGEEYEVVTGTYPMVQAQAYFNWIGLQDEGSLGVHNPPYVKALLVNSIEALQIRQDLDILPIENVQK